MAQCADSKCLAGAFDHPVQLGFCRTRRHHCLRRRPNLDAVDPDADRAA